MTTANTLTPDLIEWGLSSWLNMDINFLRQKCLTHKKKDREIGKQVYFFVKKSNLLDQSI